MIQLLSSSILMPIISSLASLGTYWEPLWPFSWLSVLTLNSWLTKSLVILMESSSFVSSIGSIWAYSFNWDAWTTSSWSFGSIWVEVFSLIGAFKDSEGASSSLLLMIFSWVYVFEIWSISTAFVTTTGFSLGFFQSIEFSSKKGPTSTQSEFSWFIEFKCEGACCVSEIFETWAWPSSESKALSPRYWLV